MSVQMILLPLFVEVILTLVLWSWMAMLRTRDFNSGAVRPDNIALREPNWPKRTTQLANAFANQFELPVLFYVLTILEYVTHLAGIVFVVLAWVFVVFRLLHAYVHVTSNIVRLRGALYGVGALVLIVMWVIYIVEVLTLH
ncbi:MAG TPA: MAPEG family protein [Xanthobacteraceae bacterium]|nr:MAPEG family protein [Xanthobacteraceae bacterium]